ncbi:hypothetical protein Poly24_01660 [Rosistilla carotiformis]|uniref:SbsA Ig-like domain-containing protein n=1 Tax=Rosistilla carotiformis TaxID=2528017 RepID=A0A518JLQ3_9BACT|nr:hypothetical protein [Rosistilla carotiformis]QDV66480.1 hypothetical protein Poly24_01660 [Rosistilla carotiformis]
MNGKNNWRATALGFAAIMMVSGSGAQAFAAATNLAGTRNAKTIDLAWIHDNVATAYTVVVALDAKFTVLDNSVSVKPSNPVQPRNGRPIVTATLTKIRPNVTYYVRVSDNANLSDDPVQVFPPLSQNNGNGGQGNGGQGNGGSGNSGSGFSSGSTGIALGGTQALDPLAERMNAAAAYLAAEGEYLRAQGEYLNMYAEARQKIADAVDKELDNWKKHVVTHFERREENMRGRMRIKDLYDMQADQTLRFRDTSMRRTYETYKNHPELTRHAVASGRALNFMLDRFAGTPIGYGIPLQETFQTNQPTTRWQLTTAMHHQLRVKTQNHGGGHSEFRLDQPTAIAFDWPVAFMSPSFEPHIQGIDHLQQQLTRVTGDPVAQRALVFSFQDAVAELTRTFYRHYPAKTWGSYDSRTILHLKRAEDFLSQKSNELARYSENPALISQRSSQFDPQTDGKDAGTLIAWMSRNGLTFVKPQPGDEAAYHTLFSMMLELYALYGEPAADVAKTDLPVKPPVVNEAVPAAGGAAAEAEQAVNNLIKT